MQSVALTTNNMSSNPVNDEVYSIQEYVVKYVSDLRHAWGFIQLLIQITEITGAQVRVFP
jgi:hypothetical protein